MEEGDDDDDDYDDLEMQKQKQCTRFFDVNFKLENKDLWFSDKTIYGHVKYICLLFACLQVKVAKAIS